MKKSDKNRTAIQDIIEKYKEQTIEEYKKDRIEEINHHKINVASVEHFNGFLENIGHTIDNYIAFKNAKIYHELTYPQNINDSMKEINKLDESFIKTIQDAFLSVKCSYWELYHLSALMVEINNHFKGKVQKTLPERERAIEYAKKLWEEDPDLKQVEVLKKIKEKFVINKTDAHIKRHWLKGLNPKK